MADEAPTPAAPKSQHTVSIVLSHMNKDAEKDAMEVSPANSSKAHRRLLGQL